MQPSEVLLGKTYWSLRAEQWGKQTGTMVNQGAQTYMPSTEDQVIAAGYHNGQGIVRGDEDLTANNLLKGIELFGVTGNYECPSVAGGARELRWHQKCWLGKPSQLAKG
ncbi:MAG: hypothetical protein HC877_14390 [Thioploca sp.]|nr:hypothetical protein [Thioploca sp.]